MAKHNKEEVEGIFANVLVEKMTSKVRKARRVFSRGWQPRQLTMYYAFSTVI